jgi:hypothetical protein
MDPFNSATGASGARITDYEGQLLLLTPLEYLTDVDTKFGDTDAVDAELVVLDGPDGFEDVGVVRIFQSILIGSLKHRIGKATPMVLGRLGTIPNRKVPDGKPAWVLNQPEDEDKQLARDYLAKLAESRDPFASTS